MRDFGLSRLGNLARNHAHQVYKVGQCLHNLLANKAFVTSSFAREVPLRESDHTFIINNVLSVLMETHVFFIVGIEML